MMKAGSMGAATTPYRLEDRYERTEGRVLLSGIQALARIAVEQLRTDSDNGLNTAALISGYPGSPLGGFDLEVSRLKRQLPDIPIVHQPAVNEELGASAVMGSQLVSGRPDAQRDGVLGIWYGKAPGLDRATDAIRHGVFAGTSRFGGAVAIVGDDPMAKSSTMPSSSDAALVDLHMPILYPGTVQECLELGLHAVAISRASGLWSAMKVVTPVADGSGTVDLPVLATAPVIPEIEVDGVRWENTPSAVFLGPRMVEVEREFHEVRSVLAQRYSIENAINRVTVDPEDAWIGLVATGYTYTQLLEALRRLGFDNEAELASAGIRLLQLRMPVPFDSALVRRFARGLQEIVVVEEKNPTLEWLIKDALYALSERPSVVGKTHEDGRPLMRPWGRLDADAIVGGLRDRLATKLDDRMVPSQVASPKKRTRIPLSVARTPFFCSGCPHNWGTKVPEGSLVGAGTGCHGMSLLMDPERVGETIGITAMGNEGAHWIGMAPFVDTGHIVQNFGDGTFFHSGQLAVQAAVGSGTTMTFKILYNDTVAMTGGQEATHRIGVPELTHTLAAHGVQRVLITTDDPATYDTAGLADGVQVWDRNRVVEAQELLATIDGVTVLIHHQGCAAEIRRDRRRGRLDKPTTRIVINHRICEGCGDCGDVSNCLSVQPLDTPLGRKTTIDQASCNLDRSCVEGDCPSFMTVEIDPNAPSGALVEPPIPAPAPGIDDAVSRMSIRMAGIGGTGVVTVAQVLATAAMLDGWDIHGLDQTGLSQKAGPVVSDVVLTRGGGAASNLIGEGEATTILAFDQLVGSSDSVLNAEGPSTRVIGSTTVTPTGAIAGDPRISYPSQHELRARFGREDARLDLWMDAAELTANLVGDSATSNVFVLGVGVQAGAVPVAISHIEEAIRLNGVVVEANLAAFAWGRAWVDDAAAVEQAARENGFGQTPSVVVSSLPDTLSRRVARIEDPSLEQLVRLRSADLIGYQDLALAERYLATIEAVLAAEVGADPNSTELTAAVAHGLHKFMAYKDEYEVARLLLGSEGSETVRSVGGTDKTATWHLHPPALRARGMGRKLRFGHRSRPAMRALAAGKRVRGTAFDPFGRAEVRRLERALLAEYEATIDMLLAGLTPETLEHAARIAHLADQVRGFEDLKIRRAAEYRQAVALQLEAYAAG
jgi:indolepyruvate ferredoxin oxidoreductase